MDLTLLSDDDFFSLCCAVNAETARRDKLQIETRLRDNINEGGFFITYEYFDLPDIERYNLRIPVNIIYDGRSKYDMDKHSKVNDFGEMPEAFEIFDDFLPDKPDEKSFERVGKWKYRDWDDPVYAKGITELNLYYKSYPSNTKYGLGVDLDNQVDIFFIESDGKYKIYQSTGKETSAIDDVYYDDNNWQCDTSDKERLVINGIFFGFDELSDEFPVNFLPKRT